MKKIILLSIIYFCCESVFAQKSATNILKIQVNKTRHIALGTNGASVDIEGYDGDDLIIEAITDKFPKTVPEYAKGLNRIPLSNRPKEDNALGYKLLQDDSLLYQINITTKCKYLHIKVPNHLYLFSIYANDGSTDSYLAIKDLKGAFQTEGSIRTTYISNVAGPFKVYSRQGKVVLYNILWKDNIEWPFSSLNFPSPYIINGGSSDVFLSLPEDLKANISFTGGEIYSDMNLETGPKSTLTLNGGGIKITTFSGGYSFQHATFYIRKQK
ncbi:MAG: hypothetical protein ABI367_07260 [Mucilaginibacter sp.]